MKNLLLLFFVFLSVQATHAQKRRLSLPELMAEIQQSKDTVYRLLADHFGLRRHFSTRYFSLLGSSRRANWLVFAHYFWGKSDWTGAIKGNPT